MKMVYGSKLDNFNENLTIDVIKTHVPIQHKPEIRQSSHMDPIANNVDRQKLQNIVYMKVVKTTCN